MTQLRFTFISTNLFIKIMCLFLFLCFSQNFVKMRVVKIQTRSSHCFHLTLLVTSHPLSNCLLLFLCCAFQILVTFQATSISPAAANLPHSELSSPPSFFQLQEWLPYPPPLSCLLPLITGASDRLLLSCPFSLTAYLASTHPSGYSPSAGHVPCLCCRSILSLIFIVGLMGEGTQSVHSTLPPGSSRVPHGWHGCFNFPGSDVKVIRSIFLCQSLVQNVADIDTQYCYLLFIKNCFGFQIYLTCDLNDEVSLLF